MNICEETTDVEVANVDDVDPSTVVYSDSVEHVHFEFNLAKAFIQQEDSVKFLAAEKKFVLNWVPLLAEGPQERWG